MSGETTKRWRPEFWIPSPIVRVYLDDGTSYDVQATSQDMSWLEVNALKGYGIDREKTPRKAEELLAWHVLCHRLKYVQVPWQEFEHTLLWSESSKPDADDGPGAADHVDPTDLEPTTDSS